MSREALVVGINAYQRLPSLNAPATDAEAIAQSLEQYGGFRVRRLPYFQDPFDGHAYRVARNSDIQLVQLEEALVQLFKPDSRSIPDTAVFFFSGHGLRKQRGIQEGFLATSDSQPDQGFFGLSLQWLRRLLQESDVRQQVIWLDCCHSGELLHFEEADPGDRGKGRDRCFIAASRSHEVAYESTAGTHSLLTQALLDGLNPGRLPDRGIDNLLLTDHVNQVLRGALQNPVCTNSGEPICLSYRASFGGIVPAVEEGEGVEGDRCPYKGLSYFDCNDEDPNYFYGRTELVDSLLHQVRQTSFLALLGASGSGKSSVLRAGLLHQIRLGQRLSGSDQWQIHLLTPGAHPLQSLARAFLNPQVSGIERATQLNQIEQLLAQGSTGMRHIVQACEAPRLVLVVDQLEEVFTLCQDAAEREAFFACLLEPLDSLESVDASRMLVLLALRADFFSHCMEHQYSGLGDRLRHHLIPIPPMNREALRDAIVQPAKKVGLEVELELVATMLVDLEGAPGHLPLLQYTLTELWKRREENCLTLHTYTRLGGILGTLRQRADAVYAAFGDREKAAARSIFLSLTQINEGTEDTRRRVPKTELISSQHPAEVVNPVLQRLTDEQLVVTSELIGKGETEDRIAMVDVAHEALIRHWPLLRSWIAESRDLLRMRQKLEAKAEEWQTHKRSPDYLLRGRPLREAKRFQSQHDQTFPLSNLGRSFIQKSLGQRRNNRLIRLGVASAALLVLVPLLPYALVQSTTIATGLIVPRIQARQARQAFVFFTVASDDTVLLMDGVYNLSLWDTAQQELQPLQDTAYLFPLAQSVRPDNHTFAVVDQTTIHLWQGNQKTAEIPYTDPGLDAEPLAWREDNSSYRYFLRNLALSPDSSQVAYQTRTGAVYLWDSTAESQAKQLFEGHEHTGYNQRFDAPTLSFSPDGTQIAAIANATLHLWDTDGNPIATPNPIESATSGLEYLAFSPNGERIVTSINGTIALWDRQGNLLSTLVEQDRNQTWGTAPGLFAISPDSQLIATYYQGTMTLWDAAQGQEMKTLPFDENLEVNRWGLGPTSLRFSPNGQRLVWFQNNAIQMWDRAGEAIATITSETQVESEETGWGQTSSFLLGFTSVDFHPSQPLWVTAQLDGAVVLRDFQGNLVSTLQQPEPSAALEPLEEPNLLSPRYWASLNIYSPTFGTRQVQFYDNGDAIALIHRGAFRLIDLDGQELLEMRPDGKPLP